MGQRSCGSHWTYWWKYILTYINYYSSYPEVCVLKKRFHHYLKKFWAAIADGKSWQKELPKILIIIMLHEASLHLASGKSPAMLLFNQDLRMKVPYIESHVSTALDQEHREKCNSYQTCLKIYHNAKQHAAPHDFKTGDIVYCTNMTPNKLDSKFSLAEQVIIKSQGRATFSFINVTTSSTPVCNATASL